MRDNNDIALSIGHISDSDVVEVISYLDSAPNDRTSPDSSKTVIVAVFSVLMFVLTVLSFISLYLRTS